MEFMITKGTQIKKKKLCKGQQCLLGNSTFTDVEHFSSKQEFSPPFSLF